MNLNVVMHKTAVIELEIELASFLPGWPLLSGHVHFSDLGGPSGALTGALTNVKHYSVLHYCLSFKFLLHCSHLADTFVQNNVGAFKR